MWASGELIQKANCRSVSEGSLVEHANVSVMPRTQRSEREGNDDIRAHDDRGGVGIRNCAVIVPWVYRKRFLMGNERNVWPSILDQPFVYKHGKPLAPEWGPFI